MKDEAEEKAAEISPCDCGGVYEGGGKVNPDRHAGPRDENCCAAYYRPAIAAALREAQQDGYRHGWTAGNEHEDALDAEIVKLKESLEKECSDWQKAYTAMCADYDKDIAKLKAERDAFHQDRDNWRASCKQVEHERDAAFVRGLQRAKEIALTWPYYEGKSVAEKTAAAIQAEIDKAKAK
jgi:hypothetical protein